MSNDDQVLQPGETVKAVGTLHWTVYLQGLVLLAVADGTVLAALRMAAGTHRQSTLALAVIAFALALLLLLVTWLRCRGTEIVITDKRVLYKRGIVSRRTLEMNISKIESVDVEQGLGGRLLNYGTVLIRGTGETLEPLCPVVAPLALRNAIPVG
jgi:uncharacterized membrane protein YdbT with pleckstrin-like domain